MVWKASDSHTRSNVKTWKMSGAEGAIAARAGVSRDDDAGGEDGGTYNRQLS